MNDNRNELPREETRKDPNQVQHGADDSTSKEEHAQRSLSLVKLVGPILKFLQLPSGGDWPASFAILMLVVLTLVLTVLHIAPDLSNASWRKWIAWSDIFVGLVLLAYIITVVLYCLSESWDQLFDALYSVHPDAAVSQHPAVPPPNAGDEGLLTRKDRRPGEFLFLIPGGRDLHVARVRAARAFDCDQFGGVFEKCSEEIRQNNSTQQHIKDQKERIRCTQIRSRLCRASILPALLAGSWIAWLARGGHELGCREAEPLALIWILAVAGLTAAFFSQRIAHAKEVYSLAVNLKKPSELWPVVPDGGRQRLPLTLPRVAALGLILALVLAASLWPCLPFPNTKSNGEATPHLGKTSPPAPTSSSLDLSFKPFGSIQPFDSGKHELVSNTPAYDILSNTIDRLVDCAKTLPLLHLTLVGSTDKFELSAPLKRTYGSNAGLARARADWIAKKISDQWNGEKATFQSLSLTVGPAKVGNAVISPKQTGEDRSVTIHALWGKDLPVLLDNQKNTSSQPEHECGAP